MLQPGRSSKCCPLIRSSPGL